MLERHLLSACVLLAALAAAAPEELPMDSVRITVEKRAAGADLVEVVYTFECRAGGAPPSLRVSLGQGNDFSASAGAAMAVDPQDRAVGTVAVRATPKDAAAGTAAVTVEIGPGGPTSVGRVFQLPAGQDLAAAVSLRDPPATSPFRHAIMLGNLGGTMLLSAYVMPGRPVGRSAPLPSAAPGGDPAAQAAEAFRRWAEAVKRGDLDQFSIIVPAAEWAGLNPEQRAQRLKEYQDAFRTVLGDDYDPARFEASYAGGATFGKLTIRYGDKTLPDLNARFVGGRWVLSEP